MCVNVTLWPSPSVTRCVLYVGVKHLCMSTVQYHLHHSAVTHLDFKMVAIKMQAQKRTTLDNADTALVSWYCPKSMSLLSGPPRGLGRPRANAKSGAPQNRLCEGGLGACPQEILRFYTLWSVFWGLLGSFFVHAHSTYIPGSFHLRLAVSDRKVWHTGP